MTKRWICLLLALLCALSMAACGKNTDTPAGNSPDMSPVEENQEEVVPEEPFRLNKQEITLVTQGEVWVLYEGNADMTQIVFSSEDESVATFFNGIVTARNSGTTTVHADYEGERYSCVVNCNLRFFPEDGQDQNVSPYGNDPDYPVQAPPEEGTVDSSFFNDAVFIGDSVTLKLSYYAASSGELGKATFLTRGSYSAANAAADGMLLNFQATELTIEEAVQATGAKKVFLMLGMNDISLYGVDKTVEHYKAVIGRIQTACPNVKIYVQSMTPIWMGGETGGLTNANVDAFNEKLEAAVTAVGCGYIDVAAYMKDQNGGLATLYCSDAFAHVNDTGSAVWTQVLKAYEY